MDFVIDLILIVVFASAVVFSYKKGFIKSLLDIFGFLVSVFAAVKLSGIADDWIYENFFSKSIIASIEQEIAASGALETVNQVKITLSGIPEIFSELTSALGFNISEITQKVSEVDLSAENAAELLAQTTVQPVLTVVIRCVVFLISVLAFIVILGILGKILTKTIDKTSLSSFNKFLGAVLGALKGFVLVALMIVLVVLLAALLKNDAFNNMINSSRIIEFFDINKFVGG